MADTALVAISADLTSLRKELSTIPNMAQENLQKMLIAVEKTVQKAEKVSKEAVKSTAQASKAALKEAQAAAKAAEKAQEDLSKTRKEGAKGIAELAGIDTGQFEKLEAVSGLLGTTGGAVAATFAGVALAVAGAGAAIFATVSKAIELKDTMIALAEASVIPPLDASLADSLGDAQDSMTALSLATDSLIYELGGTLAPAVTYVVTSLIDLIQWLKETYNSFGGLSNIIKNIGGVVIQSFIDYIALAVTGIVKMTSLVGEMAGAFGNDALAHDIKEATESYFTFKDSLGETIASGVVDNTAAGLKLMGTEARLSAKEHEGLTAKVSAAKAKMKEHTKAVEDNAKALQKQAEAALQAGEKLKDIASSDDALEKATREYEKQLEEIKKLEETSKNVVLATEARLAVEKKYKETIADIAQKKASEMEKEKEAAKELEESFQKISSQLNEGIVAAEKMGGLFSTEGIINAGIKKMADGLLSVISSLSEASGMSDIFSAISSPAELISLAGKAVSEGLSGEAFGESLVKQAEVFVQGIVEALPGLIEALAAGIPSLISMLAESLPIVIKTLAEGIPKLIAAVIDGIPDIIVGIVESIPALIEGIILGLPDLILSLITLIPKIFVALIKMLPKFLFESIPLVAAALFESIYKAFKKAKRVIVDIFKEAVTFGKAETKTFGDTPGIVRAGIEGVKAQFAPGDYVVAAKNIEGLRTQIGSNNKSEEKVVRAVLDMKDGYVFIDKALRQNIARGGVASQIGRRK